MIDRVAGLEIGARRLRHQAVRAARARRTRGRGAPAPGRSGRCVRECAGSGTRDPQVPRPRHRRARARGPPRWGRPSELTRAEFDLLIAAHRCVPSRVGGAEQLSDHIFGEAYDAFDRTSTAASRTFAASWERQQHEYVETVHGVAYRAHENDSHGPTSCHGLGARLALASQRCAIGTAVADGDRRPADQWDGLRRGAGSTACPSTRPRPTGPVPRAPASGWSPPGSRDGIDLGQAPGFPRRSRQPTTTVVVVAIAGSR